jgi:hypothetical protein
VAGVRKRESFVCKVGKQEGDLEVEKKQDGYLEVAKKARGRFLNGEESKRDI